MHASVTGKNILVMAAGTGGHIFPALAVARDLQARGMNVFWLGTPQGMEQRIIGPAGIPLHAIDIAGVRGNGVVRLLQAPLKILAATLAARRLMQQLDIDAVAGFGGYVAGPGGLAARALRLPLLVQEQNARAGLTNRLLARIAQKVCQAFPHAFAQPLPATRLLTTGNPLRAEFTVQPAPASRYAGRSGPLVIQVVGGSLGARALNELLPAALALLDVPLTVRHQCGRDHVEATTRLYDSHSRPGLTVEVAPFVDDMAHAYCEADLVICRAGASTISELAAIGVPAVLVPLPSAVDDHQTANARYLSDAGAAVLLPQPSLTPESLASALAPLLNRPGLLQMAEQAKTLAFPEATRTVADAIMQLAGGAR